MMDDIFNRRNMILESMDLDLLPLTEGFGSNAKNIFDKIIKTIKNFFNNLINRLKEMLKYRKKQTYADKNDPDINKRPLKKPLKSHDVKKRFEIWNETITDSLTEMINPDYDDDIFIQLKPLDDGLMKLNNLRTSIMECFSYSSSLEPYNMDENIRKIFSANRGFENLGIRMNVSDCFFGDPISHIIEINVEALLDYYNKGEQIIDSLRKSEKWASDKLKSAKAEYDNYDFENNIDERAKNSVENAKIITNYLCKLSKIAIEEFSSAYDEVINVLKMTYCI